MRRVGNILAQPLLNNPKLADFTPKNKKPQPCDYYQLARWAVETIIKNKPDSLINQGLPGIRCKITSYFLSKQTLWQNCGADLVYLTLGSIKCFNFSHNGSNVIKTIQKFCAVNAHPIKQAENFFVAT